MRKIKRRKIIQSKRQKYHILFNRLAFFSTCSLVIYCWVFNSVSTIDQSWFLPKDGFRTEVWDTLRVMKYYEGITCSGIGDGAEQPSQWNRYIWLSENATTNELTYMLGLEDDYLIAYGFILLLKRDYQKVTEILKRLGEFEEKVIIFSCGCTAEFYTLQDYMIESFLRKRIINDDDQIIQPNTEQLKIIERFWDNERINQELNFLYLYKIGNYQ